MEFVTIPFGFEALSASQQAAIVPICIKRKDREGSEIAWGWFQAVEAVQDPLRNLARSWLEDVWRVSELAEATVHTLWYKHRDRLGLWPARRVLVQAKWTARDLEAGSWQRRRGMLIALDGLREFAQAKLLADRARYDELYETDLHFKAISEELEESGHEDVSVMLKLVRDGCTWQEIGEQMGKSPDAARMHFGRWMERFFPGRGKAVKQKASL